VSPGAVDPAGVEWSVRRRWYPWRRMLSLRDLWSSASREDEDPAPEAPAPEPSALPRNVVLKVLLVVVMPIVLAARVFGRRGWPVEIGRLGEHVSTRHAAGFTAAGALRDGLLADIERGVLPVAAASSAADST